MRERPAWRNGVRGRYSRPVAARSMRDRGSIESLRIPDLHRHEPGSAFTGRSLRACAFVARSLAALSDRCSFAARRADGARHEREGVRRFRRGRFRCSGRRRCRRRRGRTPRRRRDAADEPATFSVGRTRDRYDVADWNPGDAPDAAGVRDARTQAGGDGVRLLSPRRRARAAGERDDRRAAGRLLHAAGEGHADAGAAQRVAGAVSRRRSRCSRSPTA